MDSNGDIHINGQAATNIEWTITASGYAFASPGYSGAKIIQFGDPTNSDGNTKCTVEDVNKNLEFKYSLHLTDSEGNSVELDPRVINR